MENNITFNLYKDKIFKNIIQDVYDIREVQVFNSIDKDILFYMSNKILKNNQIFNMPFNFYYSNTVLQKEDIGFLKDYSANNKINIIIKSLDNYSIQNKCYYANNPILDLDKEFNNTYIGYTSNLRSNISRHENNAKKHKIEIFITEDIKYLEEFYNKVLMPQYVYKHMMVFQPYKLFEQLIKKSTAKLLIARKNKEILGGIIMIHDSNVLHYNWGAFNRYENISIGTLLLNTAIKYAIEKGYKYFDFGSTPLSAVDLYKYKMRWGCINYPVFYYYTMNKPQMLDLNNSYTRIRKLYSHVPMYILKQLMPHIVPFLV